MVSHVLSIAVRLDLEHELDGHHHAKEGGMILYEGVFTALVAGRGGTQDRTIAVSLKPALSSVGTLVGPPRTRSPSFAS